VQVVLVRLLAVPWQERSLLYQAGLLDAIGETAERLGSLLLAQTRTQPGARTEFQQQIEEARAEVLAEWDEQGTEDNDDE
jgi:hypothetical protein